MKTKFKKFRIFLAEYNMLTFVMLIITGVISIFFLCYEQIILLKIFLWLLIMSIISIFLYDSDHEPTTKIGKYWEKYLDSKKSDTHTNILLISVLTAYVLAVIYLTYKL